MVNHWSAVSSLSWDTDSSDRFGALLDHQFNRKEITAFLEQAGLVKLRFSDRTPYWCAVGYKSKA